MRPPELGVVEIAVLSTLRSEGIGSDDDHRNSAEVCDLVAQRTGASQDHSWVSLRAMAQPWSMQIPLIDFRGNLGSPEDLPADARYTQVRLTNMGELVAEARSVGVVSPVALAVGDMFCGGRRPPFRARQVVSALRLLASGRHVADTDLVALLGGPMVPTGSRIEVDHHQLARGVAVEAEMAAVITAVGDGQIDIVGFPPGVGMAAVGKMIVGTVRASEGQSPIRDVDDTSTYEDWVMRVSVSTRPNADVQAVIDDLDRTWPLRVSSTLELGTPAADLLRSWLAQFNDRLTAVKWIDRFEALLP